MARVMPAKDAIREYTGTIDPLAYHDLWGQEPWELDPDPFYGKLYKEKKPRHIVPSEPRPVDTRNWYELHWDKDPKDPMGTLVLISQSRCPVCGGGPYRGHGVAIHIRRVHNLSLERVAMLDGELNQGHRRFWWEPRLTAYDIIDMAREELSEFEDELLERYDYQT